MGIVILENSKKGYELTKFKQPFNRKKNQLRVLLISMCCAHCHQENSSDVLNGKESVHLTVDLS